MRNEPRTLQEQTQLNITSLVGLTRAYLPTMIDRGHGAVINLACPSAYQPMPHIAVYAATKAFVLSFTEALWKRPGTAGFGC